SLLSAASTSRAWSKTAVLACCLARSTSGTSARVLSSSVVISLRNLVRCSAVLLPTASSIGSDASAGGSSGSPLNSVGPPSFKYQIARESPSALYERATSITFVLIADLVSVGLLVVWRSKNVVTSFCREVCLVLEISARREESRSEGKVLEEEGGASH